MVITDILKGAAVLVKLDQFQFCTSGKSEIVQIAGIAVGLTEHQLILRPQARISIETSEKYNEFFNYKDVIKFVTVDSAQKSAIHIDCGHIISWELCPYWDLFSENLSPYHRYIDFDSDLVGRIIANGTFGDRKLHYFNSNGFCEGEGSFMDDMVKKCMAPAKFSCEM